MKLRILATALLLAPLTLSAQDHWVTTWASAQQQPRIPPPQAAPAAAAPANPARPAPPATAVNNQTVRMIVHSSIGGRRARIQLSNAFGTAPLMVGSAHIAVRTKDSAIDPATDHTILFNGKQAIMVPPGATMLSDTVDVNVPAAGDLAVSLFVKGEMPLMTQHSLGLHTTFFSKEGDFAGQAALADTTTTQSWYWLTSVEVDAPADAAAIVTLGDSITDGFRSTPDTNRMWPSVLAQRILAAPGGSNIAVVNEAISGNRLLRDGTGPNALARFDRDVLSQSGVKWLTVLEGINDIGRGGAPTAPPADAIVTDDLIAAHKQIIERAHAHGIKAIGCTLTPFLGAAYYSEAGETIRQAVNDWVRTSKAYDAVIDFDVATRDPANPKQLKPEYDAGDHLHPSDAGYKAMADSIDLSLFLPKRK